MGKKKNNNNNKKTLLKFVSVTQAASCCWIQAFDLNDEQRNSWNKLKSVLQYHLFIQCFLFALLSSQSTRLKYSALA